MFIKNIIQFDNFSKEADIITSDGKFELLCYCHPTDMPNVNQKVNKIRTFLAQNIMIALTHEYAISKVNSYYGYHLQGELAYLNEHEIIVRIGELELFLDEYPPNDINVGEFIEFDVERLDCEIDLTSIIKK